MSEAREWWVLRWAEDWLFDSLKEAQDLFEDFSAKEIVHVIEYSAVQALKAENAHLKMLAQNKTLESTNYKDAFETSKHAFRLSQESAELLLKERDQLKAEVERLKAIIESQSIKV